jgi:hypothetical protein
VNFEESAQHTSAIRPEHRDQLAAYLKRAPEFSWLVGGPHPDFDRLQGDFIGDFPVVFLKADRTPVIQSRPVMVLNNTCDLQPGRSPFVSVSPVFDFEKYLNSQAGKRNEQALADYKNAVRNNKISELIYVPTLEGFSKGAVVSLDMISTVSSDLLDEALNRGRRIASFSQAGYYLLLMKLNYHLTRRESSDVNRFASEQT